MEKNPPPPKPASLPPSIHPSNRSRLGSRADPGRPNDGRLRPNATLPGTHGSTGSVHLKPLGVEIPDQLLETCGSRMWVFMDFWWVGNQPSWLICWFGAKGGSGIRSGKNTQGFQSHKSFGGDSRIPNHLRPQFTFSWNMEPAKKKSVEDDVPKFNWQWFFWFHLFRFRGVLFCCGKEKEARRVGEIENWWSSRSSGGSEGQKLRSLHMPVW